MSASLKSLAAQFRAHQKRFYASGGKPKAMKYPKEWRAAAVRLQSELTMPPADFARELGIAQSALKRWCDLEKAAKSTPGLKASFLPVEIVANKDSDALTASRGAATRVSLREVTVDIDASADEVLIAHIIAALTKTGRREPC